MDICIKDGTQNMLTSLNMFQLKLFPVCCSVCVASEQPWFVFMCTAAGRLGKSLAITCGPHRWEGDGDIKIQGWPHSIQTGQFHFFPLASQIMSTVHWWRGKYSPARPHLSVRLSVCLCFYLQPTTLNTIGPDFFVLPTLWADITS